MRAYSGGRGWKSLLGLLWMVRVVAIGVVVVIGIGGVDGGDVEIGEFLGGLRDEEMKERRLVLLGDVLRVRVRDLEVLGWEGGGGAKDGRFGK